MEDVKREDSYILTEGGMEFVNLDTCEIYVVGLEYETFKNDNFFYTGCRYELYILDQGQDGKWYIYNYNAFPEDWIERYTKLGYVFQEI